jgi:hypothetical protein
VRTVGMDETAAARGQDYVSIFMGLAERRVLFAAELPKPSLSAAHTI